MTTQTDAPLIEARSITKYFGSVIALKDVSLLVRRGEVLCLLGDNGAGKSTLIKTLSGVHPPDEGEILVDGSEVRFGSPRDALHAGHRHGLPGPGDDPAHEHQPELLPRLRAHEGLRSVARARHEGGRPGHARGAAMTWASTCATRRSRSARCPAGERQSVAIARAIHFGAKVVILDEPTSALGVKEAAVVLRFIAQAREQRHRRDLHHPQRPPRLSRSATASRSSTADGSRGRTTRRTSRRPSCSSTWVAARSSTSCATSSNR